MKITDIECFVLLVPDVDSEACSSAQDDVVVVVHTDAGVSGIGETDTNPWAVNGFLAFSCVNVRCKEQKRC